jgi:CheY-like chemotaxis protein
LSRKTALRLTASDVGRAVEGGDRDHTRGHVCRRQAVVVSAENGPFTAMLDSARFEQAVTNLLVNASKYSPEGSRIDVEVALEGGSIMVRVRDVGIGITRTRCRSCSSSSPAGTAPRRASTEGLGIGLYIAHEIVSAHGGTIAARSGGRGHGCEFTITLPAAQASLVTSEGNGERGTAPSVNGLRVLIVDDNKDAADSVAQNLRMFGHEVAVAYEGGKAVDSALAFRPDVAVIDIGLPVMNGYQVAETLRVAPNPPAMIALTGWGTEQDKGDALRAGFARHLTKPVDFEDLIALVVELGLPVRARRAQPETSSQAVRAPPSRAVSRRASCMRLRQSTSGAPPKSMRGRSASGGATAPSPIAAPTRTATGPIAGLTTGCLNVPCTTIGTAQSEAGSSASTSRAGARRSARRGSRRCLRR